MRYLLDTNVVSEARKKKPNAGIIAWMESVPSEEIYLSALTLGELKKGAALLRRKDPRAAESLENWIQGIQDQFSGRILPVDEEVAAVWGELNAIRPLPVIDSLIASTAKVHGMTVVTGNEADISGLGVFVINPFTSG